MPEASGAGASLPVPDASPGHDRPPTAAPIDVIDLFAGCGGLSAGFRAYNDENRQGRPFAPVAAVEIDPAAALTYRRNHPGTEVYLGDIAKWADGDVPQADVILGGPPCQGFSGLGKGDPNDPRNKLWREYFRVVEKARPKVFVIENVDRFSTSEEFKALESDFSDLGYTLKRDILNAADYGVAQTRRRTIILGWRDGFSMDHPVPTHAKQADGIPGPAGASGGGEQMAAFGPELATSTRLAPWVTLEECLKAVDVQVTATDLPWVLSHGGPSTVRTSKTFKDTGPLSGVLLRRLEEVVPGPFHSRQLHITRTPTDLSLARYRAIKPGENRKALEGKSWCGEPLATESWIRHTSGSGDVMGRLRWDAPSVTIRTEFFKPEKGRYLHPEAHRPITHYEAALIQGFPPDYEWYGSKQQIARQIGNAVPVGLAKALAKEVHAALTRG